MRKTTSSIICDQCDKSEPIRAAANPPAGWLPASEVRCGDVTIKPQHVRDFCSQRCYVLWLRGQLDDLDHAVATMVRDSQSRVNRKSSGSPLIVATGQGMTQTPVEEPEER